MSDQIGSAARVPRSVGIFSPILRFLLAHGVPLRTGAGRLNSTIEPRFQQRIVCTMIVPIERMPIYGGDWILWFAERPTDSAAREAGSDPPNVVRRVSPTALAISSRTAPRRR